LKIFYRFAGRLSNGFPQFSLPKGLLFRYDGAGLPSFGSKGTPGMRLELAGLQVSSGGKQFSFN
jgi:hypothetical protein